MFGAGFQLPIEFLRAQVLIFQVVRGAEYDVQGNDRDVVVVLDLRRQRRRAVGHNPDGHGYISLRGPADGPAGTGAPGSTGGGMRLFPRTWKGKLWALALAPLGLVVIALAVTVVFWSVMSFVLAALFALYGALIVGLVLCLAGYMFWRRAKLAGLRVGWRDSDGPPSSLR